MASIKAVKPKEPGDVGPKAPSIKPAPKKAEQKPKEPKKKVNDNNNNNEKEKRNLFFFPLPIVLHFVSVRI